MNDDITLLSLVDEKIQHLQMVRTNLLARINGNGTRPANGTYSNGSSVTKSAPKTDAKNKPEDSDEDDEVSGMTRSEEFIECLTKHGPLLMKDVIRLTGMPRGTAGFVAREALSAGLVVQSADKRYDLKH